MTPSHHSSAAAVAHAPAPSSRVSKKLSYKEQRELADLPARIDAVEEERRALTARMSSAEFYKEGADAIAATLARAEALDRELTAMYGRWAELDARD
jgi:ABC transport system ATP-binding/permease protein